MQSEAEIRKQVETRLRRWGLLALNGILWGGAAKLLYGYNQLYGFSGKDNLVLLVMVSWLVLFGFHALRTIYVELREYLVHRAIQQERDRYSDYEKPKRLELGEDGELVDVSDQYDDEQVQYQRKR